MNPDNSTFDRNPLLVMEGISKLYKENNVLANDNVHFEVAEGEIHALVGENGAGKTTLMKILYGMETPDSGTIYYRGKPVTIKSPIEANKLGIGMVHQHFRLIDQYTVTENIILGREPVNRLFLIDRQKAKKRVIETAQKYNLDIDPDVHIGKLSIGQMQIVEILKILYRDSDFLILDEPTSVLTEQEIKKLFDTLKNLRNMGKTIVIITHKLQEVKSISDRVTVMRQGKTVAVKDTAQTDEVELSRLMVGRDIILKFDREEIDKGEIIYELKNVTVEERGKKIPVLNNINISVHGYEIVGIAGVSGNGLAELEDVIGGLRRVTSGKIYHNGKDITNYTSVELREEGLAYVPSDRLFRGASLESSVMENMIISNHHNFLHAEILDKKKILNYVLSQREKYSIKCDPYVPIGTLSGGNIQKVILARELYASTDFILFSEPTWGLDIASSEFVYERMLELRKKGTGIMLISSNLDEILSLADTIIVMYRGRVVFNRENKNLDKETIGEYMLGIRDQFKQ